MRRNTLSHGIGLSGGEALRVLLFARDQKLTLDVALSALAAARDLIQYEMPGEDQAEDGFVPARRGDMVMLGTYIHEAQRSRLRELAKERSMTLEALVDEALIDFFAKHAQSAPPK